MGAEFRSLRRDHEPSAFRTGPRRRPPAHGASPEPRPIHDAPPPNAPTPTPAKVFRTFTVVSLIAIVIAGVLLAICYRHIAIDNITRQNEVSNLVVADAAWHVAHQDLDHILSNSGRTEPFPESLASNLEDLVRHTAVRKVKIYDRRGNVVFSTRKSEIGRHQADDIGVARALDGKVSSELVYRDAFNRFDRTTEDDNLVQTYIPIRNEHEGKPTGVFEIYTDVSAMVASSSEAQVILAGASTLVMVALYFSLLAAVRRIEKIIVVQQRALRDRSTLLTALSAQMLNAQENEKQRIAAELHERVAQTISAVKLGVEGAVTDLRNGRDPSATLESMAPYLQAATQEVRLIALGLCPPSLHELGLIPTLRWRCREIGEKYPDILVEVDINASEATIPEALRAIIYRIVDDTLNALTANEAILRIRVGLEGDPVHVTLSIGDDARQNERGLADAGQPGRQGARERTLLSGGKFTERHNNWGGMTIYSVWLR